MITRSLKEEKRQEIDVPNACVSISFRAICFPILLHIYTLEKHIVHTSVIFDCNIYITHDGWKEHLSAVFNNIVLVLSYQFLHYIKGKKKRTRVDMFFFFVSFFLSVVFLKKRKKIILIILTVSFYHRIMLHHAYLRYILFSMFLRFCKHDKTDHRSRSISFIVSFRKKGYLFLYNFSCTFNPFSGRSHIICA